MPRWSVRTAMASVAACALIGSFLIPALRERGYGATCRTNLRAIGQALHAYHAEYGCFPPAYTVDAAGRRLLSWRVLILPQVGRADLYRAFRQDEPWDGPRNRLLLGRMPAIYACPAHRDAAALGRTAYQAPVGPHTLFPGRGSVALRQLRCLPVYALAVLELPHDEVPWTAPRDLEMAARPGPFGQHLHASLAYPPCVGALGRHHAGRGEYVEGVYLRDFGANVLRADGSVFFEDDGLTDFSLDIYSPVDRDRYVGGH